MSKNSDNSALSQQTYSRVPSLQAKLETQIKNLRLGLRSLSQVDIIGCLLTGSAARGEATYRSDLDVIVVVSSTLLTYSDVTSIRDQIENDFAAARLPGALTDPLPVEFTVVKESAFKTEETEMRRSLTEGTILADPLRVLEQKQAALKGMIP